LAPATMKGLFRFKDQREKRRKLDGDPKAS
jgi:hypothetical protein